MGLPGSSNLSTDILPMLIINIALSLRQFKHAFHSFMHVIGLLSAAPTPRDAADYPDEYKFSPRLLMPGLSVEIRQALPLTVYNPEVDSGAQSISGAECSVCLQEFHKDQEVRPLPVCNHLFHRRCLDRWLEFEQLTCPLCRSSLVPEDVVMKQQQREREISEELGAWLSSVRGSGLRGLWCYS